MRQPHCHTQEKHDECAPALSWVQRSGQKGAKLTGSEPAAVPDAALASLRLLGHTIPAALLNTDVVEEDLGEHVVYFRSTFPEVTMTYNDRDNTVLLTKLIT